MAKLKPRPVDTRSKAVFVPEDRERIFQHYDQSLRTLDNRRIPQIETIDSAATLADVISSLNVLISHLNKSDLTEE